MSANPLLPLEFEILEPDEQLARATKFATAMSRRRTVRHFSPEPIPFALVEQALRAAASSPSGANKQPWVFVVVQNPELKRRIRAAAEQEEFEFYHNRATPEWQDAVPPAGTDLGDKRFLEIAPCLIVVFRQDFELRRLPDGTFEKVRNHYVTESVGIAVGVLLCALHVAGLATLTHTPIPMGFLTRELGRPEHESPFAIIPIGFPAENATVPPLTRKPLSEVVVRL
jgi:iodotyrosine deiodinase